MGDDDQGQDPATSESAAFDDSVSMPTGQRPRKTDGRRVFAGAVSRPTDGVLQQLQPQRMEMPSAAQLGQFAVLARRPVEPTSAGSCLVDGTQDGSAMRRSSGELARLE